MEAFCACSHRSCLWRFFAGIIIAAGLSYVITTRFVALPTHTLSNRGYELRNALRKLWSEHVIWTRDYIVAALQQSAEKDTVAKRLLKNQEDIGQSIIPYYGADAGKKLGELLKQHILIAVDLVEAARTNNQQKYDEADKKWKQNANDIAHFLSAANINWPERALVDMLNNHLTLTIDETKARIAKKWDADIAAFDKIFDQALMMSDALADGIIKQFPNKF